MNVRLLAAAACLGVLTACPNCVTVATCTSDEDCAPAHCNVEEGICQEGAAKGDGGLVMPGFSSSTGGASSSAGSSSSSRGTPSSVMASSSGGGDSSSVAASSSGVGVSSSSAASSGGVVASSSAAESSSSSAMGASSSGGAIASSSLAPPSSSVGASSSVMGGSSSAMAPSSSSMVASSSSAGSSSSASSADPCNAANPAPWCLERVFTPALDASNALPHAPKSTTITGSVLPVLSEEATDFWILRNNGMVLREDTGKILAGPVVTRTPTNGSSELVMHFTDLAEAWFYRQDGTSLAKETVAYNVISQSTGISAPVVLTNDGDGFVAFPRANNDVAVVARLQASNNAGEDSLTPNNGPAYAARFCNGGRNHWFIQDGPSMVSLVRAAYQPTGQNAGVRVTVHAQATSPGNPLQPPITFHSSVGAHAVVFHSNASNGTDIVLYDVVFPVQSPPTAGQLMLRDAASLPDAMSGPAAVALGEGVIRVAVPMANGTLLVVRAAGPSLESQTITVGAAALGGVIAVRVDPNDREDTFVFGDAAGALHALRNGAELTTFGYPYTVAPAGVALPIRQPPLAVPMFDDRLGLVVASDDVNGQRVSVYKFGNGSLAAALTWPEYQRDSEGSGCIVVP